MIIKIILVLLVCGLSTNQAVTHFAEFNDVKLFKFNCYSTEQLVPVGIYNNCSPKTSDE